MYISLEDDSALGILNLEEYLAERGEKPELTVAAPTEGPLEDDDESPAVRLQEMLDLAEDAETGTSFDRDLASRIAAAALGVPVRLTAGDPGEVLNRARLVRNTVEPDPNMPSLAEVRALLDEPLPSEIDEASVGEESLDE